MIIVNCAMTQQLWGLRLIARNPFGSQQEFILFNDRADIPDHRLNESLLRAGSSRPFSPIRWELISVAKEHYMESVLILP
jgi:hypothetical protein